MEAKTEQEQTQEQTRALVVVKAESASPDDPDGGLYEPRHWAQLVVTALGMLVYPRHFVSVAVPAAVAEALASRFRAQGFGARVHQAGAADARSRTLSVWRAEGPTPAERMRQQHGRALHRDGLVIEEGYRRGVEMTDEDVRQGAWFG